jgi:hypothetical protein
MYALPVKDTICVICALRWVAVCQLPVVFAYNDMVNAASNVHMSGSGHGSWSLKIMPDERNKKQKSEKEETIKYGSQFNTFFACFFNVTTLQ